MAVMVLVVNRGQIFTPSAQTMSQAAVSKAAQLVSSSSTVDAALESSLILPHRNFCDAVDLRLGLAVLINPSFLKSQAKHLMRIN
jgi:hypothetical protein